MLFTISKLGHLLNAEVGCKKVFSPPFFTGLTTGPAVIQPQTSKSGPNEVTPYARRSTETDVMCA